MRRFPSSAEMRSELGWAYLKAENLREAAANLSRAVKLDRGNARTQYRIGYYYKEQNRTDKAVQAFKRSLRLEGLTDVEREDAKQAIEAMSY